MNRALSISLLVQLLLIAGFLGLAWQADQVMDKSGIGDVEALHEHNASRLKEIIGAHGWPGVSLVGEEAAKAAWLVVQHSVSDPEFMNECVSLIEDAVAREDVAGWQLAFLQDRVRTLSGKPQYYGTQFDVDENGWPTPFPIEGSATVNERRARLGLTSIEERQEQMTEQERKRRANIEQTS